MLLRGWLMIGGPDASLALPPEAKLYYDFTMGIPDATEYRVGQWFLWQPDPRQRAICLVCVEIPV